MGRPCSSSAVIGLFLAAAGRAKPSRPVIAPDDQEVLARRGIPPRRTVVRTAVAHIHALDDAVTALDHPSAHGHYVVVPRCTSNRRTRAICRVAGCEGGGLQGGVFMRF
jgi:hypothetical protein